MARARNIKPAFFKNELLGQADPLLSLLFVSLWTLADREGRLEDRPLRIKAETFPYREVSDFNGYLTQLEQHGFIERYKVGDLAVIQIVNFRKHQAPHNTEKPSELPEKPIDMPITVKPTLSDVELTQAKRPDSLIPSTLIPDSLNRIPDSPKLIPSVTGAEKSAPLPKTEIAESAKPETDLQAACRETWKSYSDAYYLRYETEPVRNATINTQVKAFVKRIGAEESPHVAAFFVQSNAAFYVQRGHVFGNLLADAEKLRTEWATGKSVTSGAARQVDRLQTNMNAVDAAKRMVGGAV